MIAMNFKSLSLRLKVAWTLLFAMKKEEPGPRVCFSVSQIAERGHEFQRARVQINHRIGKVIFRKFLRIMFGS